MNDYVCYNVAGECCLERETKASTLDRRKGATHPSLKDPDDDDMKTICSRRQRRLLLSDLFAVSRKRMP